MEQTQTCSKPCHHFQKITQLLQSFSKSFWINNTLINLSTQKELWERKKFLLHVYKLASTNNPFSHISLQELTNSYEKPIKVIIKDSSAPVKITNVLLKVLNNSLYIKLHEDEKFMFWYFVNQFKNYNLKYNFQKKELLIQTINITLKEEIFTLLSKKNILGNQMQFTYNKSEFASLFHQKSSKKQVNVLASPSLSYYYRVLNTKPSDSLDIIRSQYLRLAKRFHPDLQTHLPKDIAQLHTQRFYKIQEAYEAIKHSKNKKIAA